MERHTEGGGRLFFGVFVIDFFIYMKYMYSK